MSYSKQRAVERIQLSIPILARINAAEVALMDLSLLGCRVESHFALKTGAHVAIDFGWGDEELTLRGEVVRCKFASGDEGVVYNTGIRFDPKDGSLHHPKLREIIARQLERALEEQRLNARGDLAVILEEMPIFNVGGTLTQSKKQLSSIYEKSLSLLPWLRIARKRGYLRVSLEDGRWRKVRTQSAYQPQHGFTVWAYEDQDQIDRLCKVYQQADDETRKLIRLCAELSLDIDDSIQPQRFNP